MNCPRCGEPMSGGVCDNCGFPAAKFRKKTKQIKKIIYQSINKTDEIRSNGQKI